MCKILNSQIQPLGTEQSVSLCTARQLAMSGVIF